MEGTSRGHISARNVQDSPLAFNGWCRHDFDCDVNDEINPGGTIWEHWCTTRDLCTSNTIGESVIQAYLTLVSTWGGEFVATITRGRRSYDHPVQLCALVKASLMTRDEALWDIKPRAIPKLEQDLFKESRPAASLKATESLAWTPLHGRCYFMFKRKIRSWSKKRSVESDLISFGL